MEKNWDGSSSKRRYRYVKCALSQIIDFGLGGKLGIDSNFNDRMSIEYTNWAQLVK